MKSWIQISMIMKLNLVHQKTPQKSINQYFLSNNNMITAVLTHFNFPRNFQKITNQKKLKQISV